MILDDILAHKRDEVAHRRQTVPASALRDQPLYHEARRGFRAALDRAQAPAVIAELKCASPSRGVIRANYQPVAHARSYAAAGATCCSVLTDERFFQGSLDHLRAVRAAVALPCLRKDFLVDPYQVDEARAAGADAVLLIVAALADAELVELMNEAKAVGVDALVEVHDAVELERALAAGARLVGVNNRDLKTLEVKLETSLALAGRIPDDVTAVAESGIRASADLRRLREAGYDACLVGEQLMSAPDPGEALRLLLEEGE